MTGRTVQFGMEPDDRVKRAKLNMYKKYKIWPQHQRLVYEYNIQSNSMLKMLVKNNRFDAQEDDDSDTEDSIIEGELKLQPFAP